MSTENLLGRLGLLDLEDKPEELRRELDKLLAEEEAQRAIREKRMGAQEAALTAAAQSQPQRSPPSQPPPSPPPATQSSQATVPLGELRETERARQARGPTEPRARGAKKK